jgi:hypothetical protein
MATMPTNEEQKERLMALLQDTADWGVLVYMQYPGDVSFLAPIVPALAGCEIVSAKTDPDLFDIWEEDQKILHSDWKRDDVAKWLRANTPDEETLKQNVVRWTEDLFRRYGVQKVR